jgi:hypothetical protein
MSAIHPTKEDEMFSAGHAEAGLRKAMRRIERLENLLNRFISKDQQSLIGLAEDVKTVLAATYYDEEDGGWRLSAQTRKDEPLPPLRKK